MLPSLMNSARLRLRFEVLFFLIVVCFSSVSAKNGKALLDEKTESKTTDLLSTAEDYFNNEQYLMAVSEYKEILEIAGIDSSAVFKKLAFSFARLKKPEPACLYIEKYIKSSLDVGFVNHSYFNPIRDSTFYQILSDKYLKKITFWTLFCLYVGFIGAFIYTVLNVRKRPDKVANFLISTFLLIHSFFMIRISILIGNYEYYLPHMLYVSASFSFLYGPLIYFYFKRVVKKYQFRWIDSLHLLPTLIFIILLFPIYSLPAEEKLRMILTNQRPYFGVLVVFKLISLFAYIVSIMIMYFVQIKGDVSIAKSERIWLRNIVILCAVYIVAYMIYAVLVNENTIKGFLFYTQIISMSLLVLYISYSSQSRLTLFENPNPVEDLSKIKFDKYKKSSMTEGLSEELKEKLLLLLNKEKVFLQNDVTLQKLADYLNTTRNNTSQIINEHFGLSFFELINTYRIEEAKKILKSEKSRNLNLIEVAYDVGYNNKVTFNKSFKKYNHTTPSEYVRSLMR